MNIIIAENKIDLGKKAAAQGATLINQAVQDNGYATIIVATGASQFEMLSSLIEEKIDWSKVTAFHLDEYIGIPISHPASFRKYLKERFQDKVPVREFHFVNGEVDPVKECSRLSELISRNTVDVAFIGIGENGHIAFNDPPADFDTEAAYIRVELDEACRRQQTNEGWFSAIEDVPTSAISMSVKQILKSSHIICSVPDERKAMAVKNTIEGKVTPQCPASILQTHNAVWLCLDKYSSSLLIR